MFSVDWKNLPKVVKINDIPYGVAALHVKDGVDFLDMRSSHAPNEYIRGRRSMEFEWELIPEDNKVPKIEHGSTLHMDGACGCVYQCQQHFYISELRIEAMSYVRVLVKTEASQDKCLKDLIEALTEQDWRPEHSIPEDYYA
ncbi:MAG: hypothetical protein K2X93_23025 [Candidatus Obscuribacterales bacterium]|nr:hypothetical protein [Candidatus Obscuribacterales bacterium]